MILKLLLDRSLKHWLCFSAELDERRVPRSCSGGPLVASPSAVDASESTASVCSSANGGGELSLTVSTAWSSGCPKGPQSGPWSSPGCWPSEATPEFDSANCSSNKFQAMSRDPVVPHTVTGVTGWRVTWILDWTILGWVLLSDPKEVCHRPVCDWVTAYEKVGTFKPQACNAKINTIL